MQGTVWLEFNWYLFSDISYAMYYIRQNIQYVANIIQKITT